MASRPVTDERARRVVAAIGDRKFGLPKSAGEVADLTLKWGQVDKIENISLRINIDADQPAGRFDFASKHFGKCTGSWEITRRPSKTTLGKGNWKTDCDSNAASGTFVVNTALTGSGSGSDREDRLVLFTFASI